MDVASLAPHQTLHTERLRLEQQGPQHFEPVWAGLQNAESIRLTGTHRTFTQDFVREYLDRISTAEDRADWAIIRSADERYLGEVVLNDLDEDNESMGFRISLGGSYGQGYGTEATRAVVAYGLDVVGLHRIALEVYAFNPRAKRVYEKCGFRPEGVARDALWWDGEWVDATQMSILATDLRSTPVSPPLPPLQQA